MPIRTRESIKEENEALERKLQRDNLRAIINTYYQGQGTQLGRQMGNEYAQGQQQLQGQADYNYRQNRFAAARGGTQGSSSHLKRFGDIKSMHGQGLARLRTDIDSKQNYMQMALNASQYESLGEVEGLDAYEMEARQGELDIKGLETNLAGINNQFNQNQWQINQQYNPMSTAIGTFGNVYAPTLQRNIANGGGSW